MAAAKPIAKPVPAKPAAALPKPAPKPAAAVAKPAAAPAPKPAAAKPAAAPAPKPVPASAKPVAPAPKAAPAPAADKLVSRAEFEAIMEEFSKALSEHHKRLTVIEMGVAGWGQHVNIGDDGNLILDIDNADEETIRDWTYQFGTGDHTADIAGLKKALKKVAAAKDFAGWIPTNELPRPGAEDGTPAEEAAPEEAAAEGEEGVIDEATINAMNMTQLKELAGQIEMPLDGKETPKTLRAKILEALTPAEEAAEEPAEEATEGEQVLEEGTALLVTVDGTQYEAVFVGPDDEGNAIVTSDSFEGEFAVSMEDVAFATA